MLQIHLLVRDDTPIGIAPLADDRIATATCTDSEARTARHRSRYLGITDQCGGRGPGAADDQPERQHRRCNQRKPCGLLCRLPYPHAASCTGTTGSITRRPACISVQFQIDSEPLRSSIKAEQLSTQSPSLQ